MLDREGAAAASRSRRTVPAPPADRGDDWTLLLRACRADVTGLADEAARRFADRRPEDWAGLVALMDAQGVGPLAACALLSLDPRLLPGGLRAALDERVPLARLRDRILVPELFGLLEAFEERGVEAITYKGPALAALAYGRPSLRESLDLDLVVREGDVPTAEE